MKTKTPKTSKISQDDANDAAVNLLELMAVGGNRPDEKPPRSFGERRKCKVRPRLNLEL